MQDRNIDNINITIPAFKEPDIISTLKSVLACDRSNIKLRIDILVNCSESEELEIILANKESFNRLKTFVDNESLGGIIFCENVLFPKKHAGVGLARKTLMDAAANRYKEQNINGIVLALDADCTVEHNYLQEVSRWFSVNSYEAASLCFAHPINDANEQIPIIEYEWHLRYFIELQRFAGFPFAFHTVGSSMACLSETYLAKGGMNKRKAGEDFYFMHKFIKDGVCGEINTTTVKPSGRVSDRVPFGTGRAVGKYEDKDYQATTYSPHSFVALKKWNEIILDYYENPQVNLNEIEPILRSYLETIKFDQNLAEIKANVSSQKAFYKRFYQFFDAFQIMKCLHFMRDQYPDVSIVEAKDWLHEYYLCNDNPNLESSLYELRIKQKC